jgi:hypothetical protein
MSLCGSDWFWYSCGLARIAHVGMRWLGLTDAKPFYLVGTCTEPGQMELPFGCLLASNKFTIPH